MAEFKARKKKKQPKNSCFMGCFGFSYEDSKQNLSSDSYKVHDKKLKKWFSLGARKVVADAAAVSPPVVKGKRVVVVEEEIQVVKGDKKQSTIRPVPVNGVEVSQVPAPAAADQLVEKANNKMTKNNNTQETILKEREILTNSDSIDRATTLQQKSLPVRKSTPKRTLSHPISPQDNPKPSRTTTKLLSHSISLPPPKSAVVNGGVGDGSGSDDQLIEENKSKSKGKFDSLVGMSILLMTLMIMLFWGKVCAIVCTSAWFYFVPRFIISRNKQIVVTTNDSNMKEIEIDSEEYKKKVILEGLLQRNHHV